LLLEQYMSVLSAEAMHGEIDNDALDARRVAIVKELAGMHELVRLAQIESTCVNGDLDPALWVWLGEHHKKTRSQESRTAAPGKCL
jgi:hypothetical protein